jgi:uncharacterized membrane protein YdbT with pleckstrin-like domain
MVEAAMTAKIHWMWLLTPIWRPAATAAAIFSGVPAALVLMALVWLYWIAAWFSTSVTASKKGITMKTGVFTDEEFTVTLKNVESIEIHQTLMGKFLGYGTVEWGGSGQNHGVVGLLSRPQQFKAFVEQFL